MMQTISTKDRMNQIRSRLKKNETPGEISVDLKCSWRLVRIVRSSMAIEGVRI